MLDRVPRNGKLSCNIQRYVVMIDTFSRVNCVNCGDSCRDHETLNAPCGHYYCGECLEALVEAFTRDESLFPLRCCQDDPISIEEVLPNLSLELRTLFQRKHEEFSIFPKNRLYCSNSSCSTFLGSSEDLVSKIECPSCLVDTCPQCKELAHPGEGCEVNASNKALQELAKSREWQTCPGCHALVELSVGCYHMTCRCNTQFCYLCAARWKTCTCDQWNERRL
jgi:IBR domain, a half RING-finger domain